MRLQGAVWFFFASRARRATVGAGLQHRCRKMQIDASAVQWAISVTIKHVETVGDTLASAVGLLDVANRAYSELTSWCR